MGILILKKNEVKKLEPPNFLKKLDKFLKNFEFS